MAREKKREHYVPRFYLRNFSYDKDEPFYLHCYDKQDERGFKATIRNIGHENYFYDLSPSQEIEDLLADLEGDLEPSYTKLVETGDLMGLNRDDRLKISTLISLQHLRTRKFRDTIKQASEYTLDAIEDEGSEARDIVEAATEESGAKEWQLQLLSNALLGFAEILDRMGWFLFKNRTEYPLWTSDHPIAIFNPINPEPDPEKGIERRGSKLHFPLSSDLVLGIFDPRTYPGLPDEEELTEKGHVDFQNKLQVEHSYQYLYSPEDDFGLAQELIDGNPEYGELDVSGEFLDIED